VTQAADLHGSVALVTGAGRGIGAACARLLAELGSVVVVNDSGVSREGGPEDAGVAEAMAQSLAAAFDGPFLASAHDLCDPEAAAAAVELALSVNGKLDALIHCAGVGGQDIPATDNTAQVIDALAVTNLRMLLNVVSPAYRAMTSQDDGRILLMASGTSVFGTLNHSAYASGKAGAIALTKSIAAEANVAGSNVRINALLPVAKTRMAAIDGLPEPDEMSPIAVALASPWFTGSGDVYSADGNHLCRATFGLTEVAQVDSVSDAVQALERARQAEAAVEPRSLADAVAHRGGPGRSVYYDTEERR
jgi:NAD(P)-dependent dehydrogenase (short-subunit alcohol dehydrogenase family)